MSGDGKHVYTGDAARPSDFMSWAQADTIVFTPKYFFRRFRLGEETVTLNMNALGRPAKIRILADREVRQRQATSAANESRGISSSISSEDLMRTIAADNEAVDPSTVNNNIEELRRYSLLGLGTIIQSPTLARCREVAQELDYGFTTHQLRDYLRQQSPITDVVGARDYECLEARYNSTTCTRSAWFSGVSSFPEEAILRLDHERMPHAIIVGAPLPEGKDRQTVKQVLIEKVLRQAWKVRCKEEKAMEGELDIRLHPENLKLLLNHKTDMFKALSEQYGAKIDISQSQHIVRLTGNYVTCSDLSKMIYYMLEKIQTVELDLPASLQEPGKDEEQDSSRTQHRYKAKEPLRYKSSLMAIARSILNDRSYIEHIEKLTNTTITTVQSDRGNYVSKLRVYYIGPETSDADDVRRLVSRLLQPNTAERQQIQCHPAIKLRVPTQIPIEVGSAVPWTERGTQWARWRDEDRDKSLQEKKSDGNSRKDFQAIYEPLPSRGVAKATGRFLLEGRARFGNVNFRQRQPIYWKINQEYKVSAVLGYIAYPALSSRAETRLVQARTDGSRSQDARLEEAFLESIASRRTMTTNLPEVLQSLEDIPCSTQDIRHEFRVRLIPSHVEDGPSVDLKLLPEIDLRISLGEVKEHTRIRYVQLIRERRESDLLLPQEVADIRFCTCTASESTAYIDPKIQRFVEESNFDIRGEERLRTPPKLSLRIPKWAISQDAGQDISRTVGVEYAYDSMEYLSYVSMSYRGVSMSYSTVEAGQAGGRRSELRFETNVDGPHNVKSEFIPFFDTVRKFVARMKRRPDFSFKLEDTDS